MHKNYRERGDRFQELGTEQRGTKGDVWKNDQAT